MRGVEIAYTCLGNNNFEITAFEFTDCSSTSPPDSFINIQIQSQQCSFNFNYILFQFGATAEVSQVCSTSVGNTTCNGGSIPGVKKTVYRDTITLPANCSDWKIQWSGCCRNNVTNVVSNNKSAVIYSNLNNLNVSCNNSPKFSGLSNPSLCANQQYTYNPGVYDPDGDSLSFIMVQPQDSTTPLTYEPGYSLIQPVKTSGPFIFDSLTGQMCFTPNQAQLCIIALLVREYRNGILIGSYLREIQFIVSASCVANQPPFIGSNSCGSKGVITNLSGGSSVLLVDSNKAKVCSGDSICFQLNVNDTDSNTNVSVGSNISSIIPNAAFSVSCICSQPVINFCWLPIEQDTGVHTFTVTLNDNACPVAGIQSYSFSVHVFAPTSAGADKVICDTMQSVQLNAKGGASFTWKAISGDSIIVGQNFSCNNCSQPYASPDTTTVYEVTGINPGSCKNKDTVVVFVTPGFSYTKSQTKTAICRFGQVQFNVTPDSVGNYSYQWFPPDFFNNTSIANPLLSNVNATGTLTKYFKITNPNGCTRTDSINIIVSPAPEPFLTITGDTTICKGDTTQLSGFISNSIPSVCGVSANTCSGTTNTVGIGTGTNSLDNKTYPAPFGNFSKSARHQFLFTVPELYSMGFNGGRISAIAFSVVQVSGAANYTGFTIKMGCTAQNSLTGFQGGLATVFGPQNILILQGLNKHNFTVGYDWDGLSNIIVEICFYNNASSFNSPVYYTATANTSVIWNRDTFDVCGSNTLSGLGNKRPNTTFFFCNSDSPPVYNYSWSPASLVNNPSSQSVLAYPPGDTTFSLIAMDTIGGCGDTTAVLVKTFPAFSYLKSQSDTAVCLQQQVQFNIVPDTAGNYLYIWVPSSLLNNTTLPNPTGTFNSPGTQYISVNISNGFGCERTDTFKVVVAPVMKPDVAAFISDSVLCTGESVGLRVDISNFIPPLCGNSTGLCAGDTSSVTIGTSVNVLDTLLYPAPFGNLYSGAKHQMLYRASELLAQGFSGGQIAGIAFNISQVNGSSAYSSFTIRMGCTALSFIPTFQTGLVTVFNPQLISISPGWNVYNFNTPFNWDGTSNLVVEVCFNNTTSTKNSPVFYTNTSFNPSVVWYRADSNNVCATTNVTGTSNKRPNTLFKTRKCLADTTYYKYSWTPAGLLNNAGIYDPVATPVSDTVFRIIVSNPVGGCADTAFVAVSVKPQFSAINTLSDSAICKGESVQFTSVPSLSGNYTYSWTPGTFLTSTGISNPTAVNVTTAGTLTYVVNVSNGGCINSDSVKVLVSPAPVPDITVAGKDSICVGDSTQLVVQNATGSHSSYVYKWSPSTGLNNTEVSNPWASPAAFTAYTIIVADTIGFCSDTSLFNLTVVPPPVPLIQDPGATLFCSNGSLPYTLSANPSGGLWSGPGISGNGIFTASAAGTGSHIINYSVTVNGCSGNDTATLIVLQAPVPPVASQSQSVYCEGDNIKEIIASGTVIKWFANAALTNLLATGDTLKNFIAKDTAVWVTQTSINGCTGDPAKVKINVVPYPDAVFTTNTFSGFNPLTVNFINSTIPVTSQFAWSFDKLGTSSDKDPAFTFSDSGTFTVKLIATIPPGCSDSASLIIRVEKESSLFIPNVFTPNGDKFNDVFNVKVASVNDYHIVIFDRWGTRVFESGDYTNAWDGGTHPAGTYYYVITATDRFGNPVNTKEMKGYVTLVR